MKVIVVEESSRGNTSTFIYIYKKGILRQMVTDEIKWLNKVEEKIENEDDVEDFLDSDYEFDISIITEERSIHYVIEEVLDYDNKVLHSTDRR